MDKENKKGSKLTKKFWILVIIICLVLIIAVVAGVYFFSNRKIEVVNEKKKGGNLVLNYSSNVNGLSLINAVATDDTIGMKDLTEGQYFDFFVKVDLNNAKEVEYEIELVKNLENSTISDKDIRIYLEKEKNGTYTKVFGPEGFTGLERKTELGSKKGNMVVAKVNKKGTGIDNYRLRMWLAKDSLLENGNYSVEVVLNGKAK